MALSFDDRWIWDFWLVRHGADHHVFYLQAPKSIGDPDARHWNVSVGHAVSRDLVDWTVLPDALAPGPAGAWDDASTWTGSVVRHEGRWYLFYTGTSTVDARLVQRIGLAESDDLLTWVKHDGPVLEADERWYEKLPIALWFDEAWRDPWVYPQDGEFRMMVTARTTIGEPASRGVIGYARSADLRTWQALPPVSEPMGFGQMEVPQLVERHGRWYVVFCSDLPTQSPARQLEGPGTGTYYLVGDSPDGPFTMGGTLAVDQAGSTYAGRLHETTEGDLVFLAWHRSGPTGSFVGSLSDPRPVVVGADGALHLAA